MRSVNKLVVLVLAATLMTFEAFPRRADAQVPSSPQSPQQNLQNQINQLQQEVQQLKTGGLHIPFDVGFVSGWAESPYDLPGGFFWGFFVDHQVVTRAEGMPYGNLGLELLTGVIQGNHTDQFASVGLPTMYANTIEIEPTLRYHLDIDILGPVKPYVLVGPGMFITMFQGKSVRTAASPGARFQPGSTDFQPGYTTGVGFRCDLSRLDIPAIQGILNRTAVNAEWRYNGLANGEQFQQYTGGISFGL